MIPDMRYLIDLTEGQKQAPSSVVTEATLPSLGRLKKEVASAMSMLSSEECVPNDFIRSIVLEISRLPAQEHIYRLFGAKLPNSIRVDALGNHWTNDFDALSHYKNFYVPEGQNLYFVVGLAAMRDIDYAMTIAYRYLFPEESELFFPRSTPIHLEGVYDYPNGSERLVDSSSGKYLCFGIKGHV